MVRSVFPKLRGHYYAEDGKAYERWTGCPRWIELSEAEKAIEEKESEEEILIFVTIVTKCWELQIHPLYFLVGLLMADVSYTASILMLAKMLKYAEGCVHQKM